MNDAPMLDERNPWLGLASFSEETREYFFGREEETAELVRRVQRKLLTVLFGQSGLGKTSVLQAGLVPRLRDQGYCPVYVRVDYASSAPEPAEQIKQAIIQAARRSGRWSQVGVAEAGESLWEFLHHRDDLLRDANGNTLIPLLIFDQFEEIFTLAQGDEFGRARAQRFIEGLADLVENRPPKALEARLETDDSAADRFDFARSDYRVLIALREDYLAPLEGLKSVMPSITQNRLRLAPMTGTQAMAAVLKPGKGLVSEEVAAAIIRFVAGGTEVEHATVEPSLLSLICRELNDTRLAQRRSEISLDLLAGSHATILSNFYERALADQPEAVRSVIEDELLTASGFRENVAEERLSSLFAAAGAAPGTLAVLVNRRLLRIEERLDVRRVELTHDVLCGVVKASRDLRKEREAREAAERLLKEQQERERAARRAVLRARKVAAACLLLSVAAVAAAIFGFVSTRRAERAERQAQQTRQLALQARSQADNLLGYLSDKFVRELESFGRLGVISEFAKSQIDYFRKLPPSLKDGPTTRNAALAMIDYAKAERLAGDLQAAQKSADEAVALLDSLRRHGDRSDATTIALALGTVVQGTILDNRFDPASRVYTERAAALIKPLATGPRAGLAAKRVYLEALVRVGFEALNDSKNEQALTALGKAKQIALANGAKTLQNVDMSAQYLEATAWQVEALLFLGRDAEALEVGRDADGLADKLLEQRPGYRLALHAIQVVDDELGSSLTSELRPAEALPLLSRAESWSTTMVHLDPNNTITRNNQAVVHDALGDAYWAMGRLNTANRYYRLAVADANAAVPGGTQFVLLQRRVARVAAVQSAEVGDVTAARAILVPAADEQQALAAVRAKGGFPAALAAAEASYADAVIAFDQGDATTSRRLAQAAAERIQAARPQGGLQQFIQNSVLANSLTLLGQSDYLLGDDAAAEHALRTALTRRQAAGTQAPDDKRDLGRISTALALALARQGQAAQARAVIAPVIAYQRALAAHNHGDQWQPVELAAALYVDALLTPKSSARLLHEAAALLARTPAEMHAAVTVRRLRDWVAAAQRQAGTTSGTASRQIRS